MDSFSVTVIEQIWRSGSDPRSNHITPLTPYNRKRIKKKQSVECLSCGPFDKMNKMEIPQLSPESPYSKRKKHKYIYMALPESVEMNKIPPLEAIAGVALFKFETSRMIFMHALRGILSLEARVNIRLSSITEFIDSIQP